MAAWGEMRAAAYAINAPDVVAEDFDGKIVVLNLADGRYFSLEGIGARLAKRGSPYASVFDALLGLAGHALAEPGTVADDEIRAEDDPSALDAAWEEQPAFGPAPQCGAAARGDVSVVRFHKRAA